MTLQTCKLSDLSTLRNEYSVGVLVSGHGVLAIHFFGGIENSRTTDDYAFASATIMAGLEAWQPWGVIIDFRRTAYSWGDRMEDVLLSPQRWAEPILRSRRLMTGDRLPTRFPTAVITSQENEDGLTTLVREQMNLKPTELLFQTMEAGMDALSKELARTPLI